MSEHWLSLSGVPAEGREYAFTDQSLWTENLGRFKMPVQVSRSLAADLFVQPQDKGCFVRGALAGSVSTSCDRCAEQFDLDLAHEFEVFEELESDDAEAEPGLLRDAGGSLELDVASLLWEQFVLSLPARAACHPECRGLCAKCGANLNVDPCSCESDEGDPRLAALRNLKVNQ